jgi:hypothetical protein
MNAKVDTRKFDHGLHPILTDQSRFGFKIDPWLHGSAVVDGSEVFVRVNSRPFAVLPQS